MVARSPMLLGGLSTCAVAPASDAVEGTTTALDPVRGRCEFLPFPWRLPRLRRERLQQVGCDLPLCDREGSFLLPRGLSLPGRHL